MKNPSRIADVELRKSDSATSRSNTESVIRNRARRRFIDRIAETLIRGVALIAISLICLIFVYVAREALPLLIDSASAAMRSMFSPPFSWQPVSVSPRYNVVPLILGTFKVTLIAMLLATPLALAAALYTAEFAPPRLREWIKPAIELLAGIPSVVTGFFTLIVLASFLQTVFGFEFRLNAFTAGVALALAVIPIIYTVSEDALSAVPRLYREASLALGASRTQTAARVVFPAAMPGIGAAVILGFGRAIGETMIVLMVSGNAAMMLLDPTVPARTLSATIAAELGEVVFGSEHYRVLFFLGTLLFLITSALNWAGDRYKRRLREKLFGSA
jgi:phosphate transport system permease protein